MEFFNEMLLNPSSITFTVLFVGLFVYVMKTNEQREEHYRKTIEVLTSSLNECESTKLKLIELKEL
jgi:hypothetical protein